MEKDETLIEPCAPALLERLKALDTQAALCQQQSNVLVEGYMAGKGWGTATHDVAVDLNSGLFTVSPKAEAAPEPFTPEPIIPAPAAE